MVLQDWRCHGPIARKLWCQVQRFPEPMFWEHPPWSATSLDDAYECVLLAAPALRTMRPDRHAFAEYFEESRDVVSFPSLGRDALLVAPVPVNERSDFVDLYRFAQQADESVRHKLLEVSAREVIMALAQRPQWLSTSGLGVGWLHVRIDSRPKYYQYAPYRDLAYPVHQSGNYNGPQIRAD